MHFQIIRVKNFFRYFTNCRIYLGSLPLVRDSSKLKQYPQEKNLELVNHPIHDS